MEHPASSNAPPPGSMFLGEYTASLDEKNRVVFPAKLRDCVAPGEREEPFVLTKGLDGCLFLYTMAGWREIAREISDKQKVKLGSEGFRRAQRAFFGAASVAELDGQGRILVPAKLVREAELEKEVAFAGVGGRVEIWDAGRWEAQRLKRDEFEKLAEEFF